MLLKNFGYQSLEKKEGSSAVVANAMRMHKNYDAVICSSNVTAKFFSEAFNIELDKIKILGMPRVDYILSSNKNEDVLKENPSFEGKKTVLYIPTFRKHSTVNISDIIQNVDSSKYNLVIKIHPLDNTEVPEEYLAKGNFSTYDLMKFADYIITDYSATAIEASLLQKPLFLYVYDLDEYLENRGLNVILTEELKSSTSKDIKDILKIIESGDYDFNSLEKFRNKYIETYNENNTENICKIIVEYLKENK